MKFIVCLPIGNVFYISGLLRVYIIIREDPSIQIMDTRIFRGSELVSDQYLVGSKINVQKGKCKARTKNKMPNKKQFKIHLLQLNVPVLGNCTSKE